MRKVYVPLAEPNEQGKMYNEFEIPENMLLAPDWVTVEPPEEYSYPHFDFSQMKWLEDKDRVITELRKELKETKEKLQEDVTNTQLALVEVFELRENMM